MIISVPSATTVGDLVRELAGEDRHDLGLWSEGLGEFLAPDREMSACGVRWGDRLSLMPPTREPTRVGSGGELFELVVAGGPCAGESFRLGAGKFALGREAGLDICIADASLSRRHLEIDVGRDGATVIDIGSSNGTAIAGIALEPNHSYRVTEEDELEAGRSLLRVRSLSGPRKPRFLEQTAGRLAFNRPPRVASPRREWTRELDAPPDRGRKARLPLAASLVPLGAGLLLFLLLKSPVMLAVAGLSPLMAISTYVSDRRGGRKSFTRETKRFEDAVTKALSEYKHELAEESKSRRAESPDAPQLLNRLEEVAPTLWERRPSDADFLNLRLGVADLPPRASLTLQDGGEEDLRAAALDRIELVKRLPSVPLTLELGSMPVAGIVGPRGAVDGVARWLTLQGAALHSPGEVVVMAGVSERRAREWEWMKWLPHLRPDRLGLQASPITVGRAGCEEMLAEIGDLLLLRRERLRSHPGQKRATPQLLLLLDESVDVDRSVLGAALSEIDSCGVSVLWLGTSRDSLPGMVDTIVELEIDRMVATVTETGTGIKIEDVTAEGLSPTVAEDAARLLAPLRDVGEIARAGDIPKRVALLELLDLLPVEPVELARRWRLWDGKLEAIVGLGADGPMRLDLRSEGPHALIAGTTGSGKSELLRTFVAAAAAACPPDQLTFLLVDYKGGAAFAPCAGLPHVVDIVSDLDEHLAERALVSLEAELKRRERILAEHGARDLQELLRRAPEISPPLLVIAVDEFAKLREEVPDFVDGVVDIAQRGRSLGVHMVLAAQTLRNAFTPAIRANTNLRLALRVAEEAESEDVIASPLAARIPSGETFRGRAYVRTGHGELREFQTAYVSGLTPVEDRLGLRIMEFNSLSSLDASAVGGGSSADSDLDSDLLRLGQAAQEAKALAKLKSPSAPWLPSLPGLLDFSALPKEAPGVAIGLIDLPEHQRQDPLLLDLANVGHVAIFGGGNSGKSTSLTSAALALARATSPSELAIYGLDCASGSLAPLQDLPHCGGVIRVEEEERVTRLLRMLLDRVEGQPGLLSSFDRVVLLLDDLSSFSQTYDRPGLETPAEHLARILAGGRAAGVHVVLTASRRAALPSALSSHVGRRLALRMSTEEEMLALGLNSKTVRGARLGPGRGFTQESREFQIAMPVGPSGDCDLQAAITALEKQDHESPVPQVLTLPAVFARGSLPRGESFDAVPFGIRDADLSVACLDLDEMHLLVAGPYRSGRSTVLATIAQQLREADASLDLRLLSPRRNALRALSIWTSKSEGASACAEAITALVQELEKSAFDARRAFVFLDDGGEVGDPLAVTALERLVRLSRDSGLRLIAAVETSAARGVGNAWIRELRREGHGVLLQPDLSADGDILGTRLPRRVAAPEASGRGFVVVRGSADLVQVAI